MLTRYLSQERKNVIVSEFSSCWDVNFSEYRTEIGHCYSANCNAQTPLVIRMSHGMQQNSLLHRPWLNPFTADPVKALYFAILV